MSDQFSVLPDHLDGHAGALDGIQGQLSTALDAARTVSMPRDAYGLICQFFPPRIDPIENAGVQALREAVNAMGAPHAPSATRRRPTPTPSRPTPPRSTRA